MGVKNDIFLSEIGSGFGNTPPPEIPINLGKKLQSCLSTLSFTVTLGGHHYSIS